MLLLLLLLLQAGLLLGDALLGLHDTDALLVAQDLGADGRQEGVEVGVQVLLGDAQVPVQEEQELLLHQVDLGAREAKGLEAAHVGVVGPVLVLGRRIVEVLGGEDKGGQEDAVDGAA